MVPYWVDQSPSKGAFPKKILSKSCNEYEVDGGKNFLHRVIDISRDHIKGSLICNARFFQSLLFSINLLWSKTLSDM
jgi:hypothetical protein